MIYSSSYIYAEERTGDGFFFLKKQILYAVIGAGAFVLGSRLRPEVLSRLTPKWVAMTLVFLVLVLIPGIGARVGGAQRWISFLGLRFQPSEMAKLAAIFFFFFKLVQHARNTQDFKLGIVAPLTLVLPMMGLLLIQPDFGSTALIAFTGFILLWVGGAKKRYLFGGLSLATIIATVLVVTSPYRKDRVMTFLDPWRDASGKGFQVIQSMVGLHRGSWFGQGLGNGKEKLFFLPEAHNDFIFAVIGEELGLWGVLSVIALYVFLLIRGLKICMNVLNTQRQLFGFFVGVGIMVLISLQAMINMAVVMGLLPTKGLTLPLVSYGGSALIMNLFALGFVYGLSVQTVGGKGRP